MFNLIKNLLSKLDLLERLSKRFKTIGRWLTPKIKRTIYILLILTLLIAVFIFWRQKTQEPDFETTQAAEQTLTETVSASGLVKSEAEVTLKFQASGQLAWVEVKEGDQVKKWQAIAGLDKKQLENSLRQELIDFQKERWDFEQDQETYEESIISSEIRRVLEKNQYDLERTVIDVEAANLAIKYATLISPIDGIVTQVDVPVAGVNITPATAAFVIADPNEMVFQANIDESEIGQIKIKQKANLWLDAYPEEKLEVEVIQIGFSSTTTSGGGTAFPVKVKLPANMEQKYKLGMNGDLEIIVSEKTAVLSIPFEAIRETNGDSYVFVQENQKFKKRAVKTGFSNDVYTQIIDGLNAGETVALSGFKELERQNQQ
ncbi:efflux RND transporter periplasmic adaptor subunit [Patescibacteria group bacterium]|nr:efflux RND transporter periplasmic adaptor subunit [Patescibacteria group bacterium]